MGETTGGRRRSREENELFGAIGKRGRRRPRLKFDTTKGGIALPLEYNGAQNACTEVQVFHREYRENEAKTTAKVDAL
jgi:hypothetical protein